MKKELNEYTNRQAVTDLLGVIRNMGKLLNNHEERIKQLEKRVIFLERRQSVEDDGR